MYRLTLVKAWNAEELQVSFCQTSHRSFKMMVFEGYADLVSLGRPSFIEIKGVTFCGDSKASSLTMQNVPWHEEV